MSRPPGPAPSENREIRVKRSLANPVFFGQLYFAPYDPNWQDAVIPRFAQEMFRFVVNAQPWPDRAGVIMLPPEFLKTTLISQVYPLWLTARARVFGQLLRGMLLAEEEGMAKGNLAVISWHILNNERLRADFADTAGHPLLVPDEQMEKWSDEAIIVQRPGIVSRDPTWQAKGLDSKGIQGRRLDRVIGDDVVTPKNASRPAKRKSALDVMDLEVETRVVEGGQILVAGNFNDAKDLLSTLAARPRYRLFKRPSFHRPDNPAEAPEEGALHDPARSIETWPENWSRRRLMIEYRDKPNRFRRIHLLDPRAEQGEKLKTSWVQLLTEEQLAPLLKYAKIFMAVDPASGGDGEDLDFTNITAGALTAGHFDVLQSFNLRADLPRTIKLVGSIHDAYAGVGAGVVKIGCAKVNMDRVLRDAVVMQRPDLKHKLWELTIPQIEAAKEVRLEGLGPRALSGWLRVLDTAWTRLTSDPSDQNEELTLEEEWREFPYGRHDDRLDGLDMAARTAQESTLMGDVDFTLGVADGH